LAANTSSKCCCWCGNSKPGTVVEAAWLLPWAVLQLVWLMLLGAAIPDEGKE